MKRTPKKTMKAVHILADAEPRFVSLVGHGANQTPFNVVKLDPNAQRPAGETATGAEPMSKKVVAAAAAPKTTTVKADAGSGKPEIQSMLFATEHFADEAAVRVYLTEHQYEDGLTVTKTDGGFTVVGHKEDEFEDGTLSVITHANVKITVGRLKAEAEGTAKTATTSDLPPAAAAEPGAPAEAPAGGEQAGAPASAVQRTAVEALIAGDATAEEIDAAYAIVTNGIETVKKYTGLNEVLQYMDDVPVGFYDLMSAFGAICRYACRNKEYEKITKAAKELGGYIVQLAAMFEAPDDGAAKGAASTETVVEAPAQPAAKAPVLPDAVAAAAQPAEAPATTEDDRVAAAVAKAIGPLTDQIKTLQETVDKAAAPATAVSGIEVSRKGAEEVGNQPPAPAAKPEDDKTVKENAIKAAIPKSSLQRNLLGF